MFSRFANIIIKTVNIAFVLILLLLTLASIILHCEMDIYSSIQVRNLERQPVVIYLACMIIGVIVLCTVFKIIDFSIMSKPCAEQISLVVTVVTGGLLVIGGLWWCWFYDGVPKNDQITVFVEAQKIAGFRTDAFNINYVECFPRQKGQILFMALVMKIVGNSVYSWRLMNLFGIFFLLLGMGSCIKITIKRDSINIFLCLIYVLFVPLIIYTAFHYGTLLAIAFSVWACYGVFAYVTERKRRYVFLSSICFAIGLQMHQSVAIVIIAVIIYLFFNAFIEKKDCVVMILAVLLSVFILNGAVGAIYSSRTDYKYDNNKAYSALEYLYMGITADTVEGGPGSIDGSFAKFVQLYPDDVAMKKKAAIDAIKEVVGEYFDGTRDSVFFIKKVGYQWLDPTFGARKTIILNDVYNGEPGHSKLFCEFYFGKTRQIIFTLLNILMIVIYFFALVAGVRTLLQKRNADIHFFIQIYFLGGFTFQILWESLSRYCLPYFLWLIPEALFGVSVLADNIHIKRYKEKNNNN